VEAALLRVFRRYSKEELDNREKRFETYNVGLRDIHLTLEDLEKATYVRDLIISVFVLLKLRAGYAD
jgi:hypothetical protein